MAVLEMTRTFAASPEKVFAFVTKSENLLNWWGPEGVTISDHDLDFSRLGGWWAIMSGPNGVGQKVVGDVIAIDPPNTVELTLAFVNDNDERFEESTIRFEMRSNGTGGTDFLLHQSGLKEEYIPDMRDKGWNSALQRLENLILQS